MFNKINLSGFNLINKPKEIIKAYEEGVYSDTPSNRKLGRVGMTYKNYESLIKNKTNNKGADMPLGEIFNGYKKISESRWQKVIEDDKREMTLVEHELEIIDCEYAIKKIDNNQHSYPTEELAQEGKKRLNNRIELNNWLVNKYKFNPEYFDYLSNSQVGKDVLNSPAGKKRLQNIVLQAEQKILDETQQEYEACFCCDSSGEKLFEQKGEKLQIQISPENLRLMQDAEVFTHNHPSSNAFSYQDIQLALYKNIAEMRAICSDAYQYGKGAFVFRKGPNLNKEDFEEFKKDYLEINNIIEKEHNEIISEKWNSSDFINVDEFESLYEKANGVHYTKLFKKLLEKEKYKQCQFYFEDEKGTKKEIKYESLTIK